MNLVIIFLRGIIPHQIVLVISRRVLGLIWQLWTSMGIYRGWTRGGWYPLKILMLVLFMPISIIFCALTWKLLANIFCLSNIICCDTVVISLMSKVFIHIHKHWLRLINFAKNIRSNKSLMQIPPEQLRWSHMGKIFPSELLHQNKQEKFTDRLSSSPKI